MKIIRNKRADARITEQEKNALLAIAHIENLGESDAIRFVIRFAAKAYNLWPTANCPDCDSSKVDAIGGQNVRCENCGTHFAK